MLRFSWLTSLLDWTPSVPKVAYWRSKNLQQSPNYATKPFGSLLQLLAGVPFFISSKQRCGDKEPGQLNVLPKHLLYADSWWHCGTQQARDTVIPSQRHSFVSFVALVPSVCWQSMFRWFIYGCFLKWWYPKMDGLYWKTLLRWMIWGYHHFRKHPYVSYLALQIIQNPRFGISENTWPRSGDKNVEAVILQKITIGGGFRDFFWFSPLLGEMKWSCKLTNMFRRGWNHQLP